MTTRRIVKLISFTFLGLFALFNFLVMVLALWVFAYPHEAWRLTEKYVFPSDLKISWQKMEIQTHRNSWFDWDVDWTVSHLDVQKGEPLLKLPVDVLRLRFSVVAFAPGLHLTIHELLADAQAPLVVKFAPTKETTPKSFHQQLKSILGPLSSARHFGLIEQMNVSLKELRWLSDGAEPLVVGFAARKEANENQRVHFQLALQHLAPAVQRLDFQGEMDMDKFKTPTAFLEGVLQASGRGLKLKSKVTVGFDDDTATSRLDGEINLDVSKEKLVIKPKVFLSLDAKSLDVHVVTSVNGLPGPIHSLNRGEVRVTIPMENGAQWSSEPSRVRISSLVPLFFMDKNLRVPLEQSCQCHFADELGVRLEGQVWLKTYFETLSGRHPLADLNISVESVKNKMFSVDLGAHLKVDREGQAWLYEPSLDADIQVLSYQSLRQFLDAKNIIVPAPFDVLEGTLHFTARGPVQVSRIEGEPVHLTVPFAIDADLGSKRQKVGLSSVTQLKTDMNFKVVQLNAVVKVRDFQVELPPLDPIQGLPRLRRDQRLQSAPPPPAKAPRTKIVFNLDLETTHPGAIRLLSVLAVPNIPITLQMHQLSQANGNGFVRVEPFQIHYLRRTVHVEKMQLEMSESKDEELPIDGRLRIDQTDYKIFIDIKGTTAKPIFQLSSEPYLGRNDIISVLLYDRVTNQLVSSDAETAGGVEAAMADRAIGLFGIWAFATTPIRSFSYNGVTKVYTATVQLADGLTAGIGTDWEHAAHLEVRKRVSKQWVLTASWSPSEDQQQVGKVVLQWEKRF